MKNDWRFGGGRAAILGAAWAWSPHLLPFARRFDGRSFSTTGFADLGAPAVFGTSAPLSALATLPERRQAAAIPVLALSVFSQRVCSMAGRSMQRLHAKTGNGMTPSDDERW